MEYDPVSEQDLMREMRHVRLKLKRKRLLWGFLLWSALAAAAGWFLFDQYFSVNIVRGADMEDTMQSNSVVLCRRVNGANLQPGDVALFSRDGQLRLKRVAAIEGDQVMLSLNGRLWINGVPWQDGARGLDANSDMLYHPVTVPEGALFVVGDRFDLSDDSRSSAFGMVEKDQVMGKLILALWPPYQAVDLFMEYVGNPVMEHVIQPAINLFRR